MTELSEWMPIAKAYAPLKAGSIDGTDTRPHDHAIERALQAEYYPNKRVVGNPGLTLFVSRLNPKTTEDVLRKTFSEFGQIVRCRLIRDTVTGFSKCYSFVEFSKERDAYKAHRAANKTCIEGYEIFVDFECERTMDGWVPRRLGGGLGGKKESGQLRFGGRDRPFRKPILLPVNNNPSKRRRFNKKDWFKNASSNSRYLNKESDTYQVYDRNIENHSRRDSEKYEKHKHFKYDDAE